LYTFHAKSATKEWCEYDMMIAVKQLRYMIISDSWYSFRHYCPSHCMAHLFGGKRFFFFFCLGTIL